MQERQPAILSSTLKVPMLPELQGNTVVWKTWVHRYRTRRQLHDLLLRDPERLIQDLGISLDCARAEIEKPFWR